MAREQLREAEETRVRNPAAVDEGLGFRVSGSGFRVSGFGFRV